MTAEHTITFIFGAYDALTSKTLRRVAINEKGARMRPTQRTDVYPTRYHALDNPGAWAVFTPTEGRYRSCREDADYRPVDSLGVFPENGAELAVLCEKNGDYAEIRKSRVRGEFLADVYKASTKGGTILFAPTMKIAMTKAEKWLKGSAK